MFRNDIGRSEDAAAFRNTFHLAVGPGFAAATINESMLRVLTDASRSNITKR